MAICGEERWRNGDGEAKHFSMCARFTCRFFTWLCSLRMGAVLFSRSCGSRSVEHFFARRLGAGAWVFDALDGRIARWRRKHLR